ncbi:MAG: 16S rRNA (guanine(527)-N(7))-methyltransferase RsmG [Oscillospiraceae bacterium]|nr:16S rRNA (guanine(527)-N(7))-methyltransferase RsmG [Oscillospiraceae bacterium]
MSDITLQGAKKLNITLPPETEAAFEAYYDLLSTHGENVNLTAISGAESVAHLHFLDSIALLTIADFKTAKVIDIGSGAGFPGVPLKLAEPSVDLTLLDATRKRIDFLEHLCALINIDAACIHARAEEAAHTADMREQYDICVSRAVAKLNSLCELCLPFVKPQGLFIAMKSVNSEDELRAAHRAIEALGAQLHKCVDYTIPDTDIVHRAVIIKKTSKTSERYPRRFARIQKSPL